MLTISQLRQSAALSGMRDINSIEIEVILTHLLQLFNESGVSKHLAFKGGTFLRKMVFGPKGRLSTDLDFTCYSDISLDDLTILLLETLSQTYHGISFRFDKNKDWYLTNEGCAANPVCMYEDNQRGVKIKIQISTREAPMLPISLVPQIEQNYFKFLSFTPALVPCLSLEEVIAEKIRAANQRSKIRDLYDLAEISRRPLNQKMIRSLAVLKLWQSGGDGLNFDRFHQRVKEGEDYNIQDLQNLLRKDQKPDLDKMIEQVCSGFKFLKHLTEVEYKLSADSARRLRREAENLKTEIKQGIT